MTEQTNNEATPASAVAAEHGTNTPTSLRDQMVQAARDAKAASVEASPESEEKEAPIAPESDDSADDEPKEKVVAEPKDIHKVAKALKDRERKRLEDKASKVARSQESNQFEQERHRFAQQQAQLEQERQSLAAERAKIQATLKDPFKIAELTGKSHAELAQDLAMAGTPEWQLSQRIQAQLEELRSKQTEHLSAWEEHKLALKQQQERNETWQRESVERAFVERTASSESYPVLSKLPAKVRLDWGKEIAKDYFEEKEKVLSDEEIALYQERSLSGEAELDREGRQQTGSHGKAPTIRANGPRTLSTSVASERRSSPKSVSNNLSRDDMRKEMLIAAREAKKSATG